MESLNWASFRVKSSCFDAGLRLIREPLESPKIDLETDESEATDSESKLPEFDSFDSGLVRKIREIRLQISAVFGGVGPKPLYGASHTFAVGKVAKILVIHVGIELKLDLEFDLGSRSD